MYVDVILYKLVEMEMERGGYMCVCMYMYVYVLLPHFQTQPTHPPQKKQQALQRYKTQAKGTETSDYEAMQAADAFFSAEAENCIRKGQ